MNYKKFDKKFLRLNDEQKLEYINYLIFKYCENYAISPDIKSKILSDKNLGKLAKGYYDSTEYMMTFAEMFLGLRELVDWRDIPNLLAENNKLR